MRVALAVVCLLVGWSNPFCRAEPERIGLSWYDPLVYTDLVVRATVEDRTFDQVTRADYLGPGRTGDHPMMMVQIVARIDEVLKGSYHGDTVKFAGLPLIPLRVGQEYVLCLRYKEHLKGGMFDAGDGTASFVLSEGMAKRVGDNTTLTYDEIRSITQSASIESVARSADLIVVGRVVGLHDHKHVEADGRGKIWECTVEVDSLLKGTLEGRQVAFQFIRTGLYAPPWRTHIPPGIDIGQTWYLFLKKTEIEGRMSFYPFAGSNGMLKIQGDRLIYDFGIDFPYNRSEVDQIVQRESSK